MAAAEADGANISKDKSKKKGAVVLGFTEEEQERIAREVTCDV